MARLIGPDESCRLVYLATGANRGKALAQGLSAVIYADAGLTTPANILTMPGGAAIANSTVTIDSYSRIPLFQFPDGVDTVYTSVGSGPATPLYARVDDRLDSLATTAAGAIPLTQRGVASGVATLDSAALLPVDQLTAGWDASPLRMPSYVQPAQILTTFQASHGWSNNAGSTFTANYTGDYILGSQCAQIVTGGTHTQANVSKTGMASFDATGRMVRLRFKVISGFTAMQEIGFFLGSSNFTNFYKWSIQVQGGSRFVQPNEWCTVTLSFHDATSGGSPVRSALTDGRCFVTDDGTGTPVTVLWQSVELIPEKSSAFPGGVISICFDDSYISQWTSAKPGLDSRGWPGVAYTIDDYIDSGAARLTLAQLKAMQDHAGWEIAAHAHTAVNHSASYTGLTAAQLEADIRGQRASLMSKGLRASDGTAYPLGQYGSTSDGQSTLDIVRSHWGYARTTSSRLKETLPPADRWRLRAISAISTFSGGYLPATLTTAVTGDIAKCATYGTWLILVFHDIVPGTPTATTQCQQSDYDNILAAIASSGIPVLTVSEVLRKLAAQDAYTFGTAAGTVAQGSDSRIVGALQAASNLSDLGNVVTARNTLAVDTSGTPADRGWLAWTQAVSAPQQGTALTTAGTLYLMRLRRVPAGTVSNALIFVTAAGVTLTSGQCFAALYTAAGALVAQTADQATSWASTGLKTMAFTAPYSNPSTQDLYLGVWFNGTTGPALARGTGVSAALINAGLSSPNFAMASADTGLTTTPPANFAAQTSLNVWYWAALS